MDLFFLKKVPPNCSPLSGIGQNLATRPEGSGKTENVNFNKFAENRQWSQKKMAHYLLFSLSDFNKVGIYGCRINLCIGKWEIFLPGN